VSVPRKLRGRPGIRVHRTTIHPADATVKEGLPVTSPARTLLDLAATDDPTRALNEAHVLRLVTDLSLNEQFSRYPRHRGTQALRQAIQPEPKLTRSEAERRALELIRRARLPQPETNVRLKGHEVDLLWREQRLVVEVDGYAFHSVRRSFEHDRRRDADLITSGYTVMRVTWRQIEREPEATAATLATALSLRS
jgi:very-short-patch-repair endonuclease